MEIDIKDYIPELKTYFPGLTEAETEKIVRTSIGFIKKYCSKGEVALTLSSNSTLVGDGKIGKIIFTRIYGRRAVNNLKKIKRLRDERNSECK